MLAKKMPGVTLHTKLMPPGKRSALIERQDLAARLDRIRQHRLLLVCAPAGYGKTSVLIQAHARLSRLGMKTGWISLDEGDKDLTRFISYLLDAVRRAGIKFGQALSALLGADAGLPLDTLRSLVLNELATLDEEVVLILDDYHLVNDPEIRSLVNALLLSPIQQLRFLISSRTHNELPLGRLRALGQLQEVEIADLTFSESEVSEFVARVRGAPLNPAQVARLREGTEGWAASLQMAGIALRDISDVDRFLDRFSGEHRSVGDFLVDEVLQRQPPELQAFMEQTSILKRFNWSLCNAVTGRCNGRAMIDELERRNLFVFSLDQEHHWFRYHHLFADFLRRRLAEHSTEAVATCHRRASDWLAEHRFMTDAIEHAFAAGETRRAGELLDRAAGDLFAAGQTATLMSLSGRLPSEVLERLPRLQLERAWNSELSWKFAEARQSLQHVQAVLEERQKSGDVDSADRVFLESKLAHRVMMLALLSDDMPLTVRLAREWIDSDRTQDAFMCASAGTAMMNASRVMFHCEGVATSARMLHARFVEGGALYGVVFHQSLVGATFFERGDLDPAQEAYEKALQVAVELHGEHSALYNMPALMFSELYYERNRLRQAEEALAQRDITSELGFVDNLIAGFITRARLHVVRGMINEAENLLGEGAWLAGKHRFERMQAEILHERLRLLSNRGRTREAVSAYRETNWRPDLDLVPPAGDGASIRDLLLAMAAARCSLAAGTPREAVVLLKPWFAFTRGRHCYRSAIRCGVLLAHALSASNDRRAAQRVLLECLQLGEAGGFVRSFVDEGPDVAELLSELGETAAQRLPGSGSEYLASILRAIEDPDSGELVRGPVYPAAQPAVSGLLSQREIQILELGAKGHQNLDIAQALFLAESTVKWYWQRIFDKLDVRRRPDAIKCARQHHWIS